MRRSAGNTTKPGGKTTKVGGRNKVGAIEPGRLTREWRRLYPHKPAESVAALLDAPVRTVENWLGGASTPSGYWTSIIAGVFGPEFLEAVMPSPPAWIVAASRQARRERLDRELAVLNDLLENEGASR